MPNNRITRLSFAILAGAAGGIALLGLSPFADAAPDPAANPPNCSSADLQWVQAGVDASTSAYLFTHPDLNGFMSGLAGLSREQVAEHVMGYLADHPVEKAEMTGIRRPLQDLKNRCGAPSTP
ncbi:heme-binding protein [Mycolicibacterium sp. XJ662]